MKISLAITLLFGASTYGATFSNGNPTDLNRQTYHKGMARGFGPEILREYNTPTFQQKQKTFFQSDPQEIALDFAKSELGAGDFIVQSSYKSDLNGVTHVYLRQRVNDLEVLNGDMNINVGRHGDIISYGNSFAKTMVNQHSFASVK
jgi:extracellular elastinolytic metalloproteinase